MTFLVKHVKIRKYFSFCSNKLGNLRKATNKVAQIVWIVNNVTFGKSHETSIINETQGLKIHEYAELEWYFEWPKSVGLKLLGLRDAHLHMKSRVT